MDCIYTALYNIAQHSPINTHIHRQRYQPCKVTASSSGAVSVRCLAQGHLDTQTINLPVTSRSRSTSWAASGSAVKGTGTRESGVRVLSQNARTARPSNEQLVGGPSSEYSSEGEIAAEPESRCLRVKQLGEIEAALKPVSGGKPV